MGAGVTSLSLVGRRLVVGTVSSEVSELTLPAPEGDKRPSKSARFRPNNPKKVNVATRKANSARDMMDENKEIQARNRRDKNQNKRRSGISKEVLELVRLGSTPPEVQLLSTCHSEPIYDVTFPR